MALYGFWELAGNPALVAGFDPAIDAVYLPVPANQVLVQPVAGGTAFTITGTQLVLPMAIQQIVGGTNVLTANGTLKVGDNLLSIAGDPKGNAISGSAENDQYLGLFGNDTYNGGAANDLAYGGSGNDRLLGGPGNDVIYGNKGGDQIHGEEGEDTLYGGQQSDAVNGGAGHDLIYGNLGNDTLVGRTGLDVLYGGQGHDVISGSVGNDTLLGNRGDDNLGGGSGNDVLIGGTGSDTLDGGSGSDHLSVISGVNFLFAGSGPGNDTLVGGIGDDFLLSQQGGADILMGGPGADNLYAGAYGTDIMAGGVGPDDFYFSSAAVLATAWTVNGLLRTVGTDQINDFVAGSDRLLFNILNILNPAANQVALITGPYSTYYGSNLGVQIFHGDSAYPTTSLRGFVGTFRSEYSLSRYMAGFSATGTPTFYGFALNTQGASLWLFQARDVDGFYGLDGATVLFHLGISGTIAATDIILF